jgi:catechol 2,3-dioxygenase-like lactoylglutathione lyase family enzyme
VSRPSLQQFVAFVATRDLAASAQFYEQVLGLVLVLDQGSCRIYRVAGEAFLGLCLRETAPNGSDDPAVGALILTLVSSDVAGWYEELTARGVLFERPPAYNPQYHITHCFLRDPNGYLIEIQSFHDPAWPAPQH